MRKFLIALLFTAIPAFAADESPKYVIDASPELQAELVEVVIPATDAWINKAIAEQVDKAKVAFQSQLNDATTTNAELLAEVGRLQTELAAVTAKYESLNKKLQAIEQQTKALNAILNPPAQP